MHIVGFSYVDFKTSDNVHIQGTKVFYTYDLQNGFGVGCDSVFVTDNKIVGTLDENSIGGQIDVRYNRYGKVDKIIIL